MTRQSIFEEKSYKFIFVKTMSRDLLVQMAYLRSFRLNRNYSYPFTLSNAGEPLLKLNSRTTSKFRKRNKISSFTHFLVVVVQNRQGNVQKSVMHVKSCCFANKTYCFLDVLVSVASLDLEIPILSPGYLRYCGTFLWKLMKIILFWIHRFFC